MAIRFLLLFIFGSRAEALAASTSDLIAHYRFDTNGEDCLGKSPGFVLTNSTPFPHEVLYVNGMYHQDDIQYLGTPRPLPGLNYESFTVGMDFYPLPAGVSRHILSKLEKRLDALTGGRYSSWRGYNEGARRNLLTGGKNYRWIGFNREDNLLNLTLNNQTFTHQFKGVRINPNRWHHLDCSVDLQKGQILTWLDGRKLETIKLPTGFQLEVIGSVSDTADRDFTFMNLSNGSVYYGYVANLKIFGRALTDTELASLYDISLGQRPKFPRPGLPWKRTILIAACAAIAMLIFLRVRLNRHRYSATRLAPGP
jgi:hypothetical protein